ncbi:hypothetical protein B0H21DRAFT_121206 [Amylocystis lapponica]|nr:hypothetical protein B0H21DRAFT_121206 [Amylocystis lapponica]
MSVSPPIRRLSSTSSSSREDLIYQYEAEEERIINVLSRKLERLREEKIELENALEAESEAHVNRLSREISALRLAQVNGSGVASPPETRAVLVNGRNPAEPTAEVMLDAMRRENEQLRTRLVDTERDYIRITRLNEVYREELIDHRRRLGLPVDNLIGLSSVDPYSQPTHRRSNSSASSPSTSILVPPSPPYTGSSTRPMSGVPIPRPPSQIHRPAPAASSSITPPSHSPSSASSSPYPFSPSPVSPLPASYLTSMTTPPSSASLTSNPPHGTAHRALSYPSVPPPSLSSSFGSPNAPFHMVAHPGAPPSPADSFGSRGGGGFARRGSLSRSSSRRTSAERGARVAETGSLARGRARRESLYESLYATLEDMETPGTETAVDAMELGEGEEAKRTPQGG